MNKKIKQKTDRKTPKEFKKMLELIKKFPPKGSTLKTPKESIWKSSNRSYDFYGY